MKHDEVLKTDRAISGSILTRSQMKQILGGNVSEGGTCSCRVNLECSVFNSSTGKTHPGNCDANWGGGSGTFMPCGCSTDLGPYQPSGGTSHCCA